MMSDEISGAGKPNVATARKQAWTPPRIESVEGRQARGSVFSYGGPDAGIYS
jgi:hypothetical protein